jgi:tetratricopeptide (TPR) repeat protein
MNISGKHLGDAYLKKQEYEKAIKYFNKALSLEHPHKENLKEKIAEAESFLEKSD